MKKKTASLIALAGILLSFGSCSKESELTVNFPSKFEGKSVELISLLDSVRVDSAKVSGGVARFSVPSAGSPVFMQVTVDGRVRAYYVAEPGHAVADTLGNITGTPLNDRLSELLVQLDSVENLDDTKAYTEFVEIKYNDNKDNVIGDYLGVEWLKWAAPERVDSMLAAAPAGFRSTRRVKYYEAFARHRAATAPGRRFIDFKGETATGAMQSFSSLVKPGRYTLVDFWASWCPYCIKELPALAELREKYAAKGFEVVSVAVRDTPEDTRAMVKKRDISWPVLYNTQKVPYDIYGFTGIPHLMLIGPDGTIISRGESPAMIDARLERLFLTEKPVE